MSLSGALQTKTLLLATTSSGLRSLGPLRGIMGDGCCESEHSILHTNPMIMTRDSTEAIVLFVATVFVVDCSVFVATTHSRHARRDNHSMIGILYSISAVVTRLQSDEKLTPKQTQLLFSSMHIARSITQTVSLLIIGLYSQLRSRLLYHKWSYSTTWQTACLSRDPSWLISDSRKLPASSG